LLPIDGISEKRDLSNLPVRSENENPGALAGATGANVKAAELRPSYVRGRALLATQFWDPAAGSIERLAFWREALA
jgi:hypothetical protein